MSPSVKMPTFLVTIVVTLMVSTSLVSGQSSDDAELNCVTPDGRGGECKYSCPQSNRTQEYARCSNGGISSLLPLMTCCPKVDKAGVLPLRIEGCGRRPEVAPIVGGIDSVPNSWPWAVAVYQKHPRDASRKMFICGASIINDQHVVSASHCIVRMEQTMKASDFFIKVGGHDLKNSGEFYDVQAVYPHENYRAWKRYNDVAIFRLNKKLDFSNPAVRPVCLPTEDMDKEDFTNQTMTVIGWGTTTFGGEIAKNLMEVDVPVVSNQDCDKSYNSIEGSTVAYPQGITHNFICAGDPQGGKDSCQGDSGGPLLMQRNGIWYQMGVVSFGYKCAEPGYPGVYTRTSNFLKWIGSHSEDTTKKVVRGS